MFLQLIGLRLELPFESQTRETELPFESQTRETTSLTDTYKKKLFSFIEQVVFSIELIVPASRI